jgi:hypothetical protein
MQTNKTETYQGNPHPNQATESYVPSMVRALRMLAETDRVPTGYGLEIVNLIYQPGGLETATSMLYSLIDGLEPVGDTEVVE